jgi:hypothetical protein
MLDTKPSSVGQLGRKTTINSPYAGHIWTDLPFLSIWRKTMIPFLWEVMNLYPENVADAIRQALGWLKANGTPGRRRGDFSYAHIARAAFEDIRELAAAGFSYAAICEAFETNGLLPKGSKPYSLSRAVRRETARRQKRAKPAGTEQPIQDAGSKLDTAKTPTSVKGALNPEHGRAAAPDERKLTVMPDGTFNTRPADLNETDIKAVTTTKIKAVLNEESYNNGRGFRITKHSNGSFSYD